MYTSVLVLELDVLKDEQGSTWLRKAVFRIQMYDNFAVKLIASQFAAPRNIGSYSCSLHTFWLRGIFYY